MSQIARSILNGTVGIAPSPQSGPSSGPGLSLGGLGGGLAHSALQAQLAGQVPALVNGFVMGVFKDVLPPELQQFSASVVGLLSTLNSAGAPSSLIPTQILSSVVPGAKELAAVGDFVRANKLDGFVRALDSYGVVKSVSDFTDGLEKFIDAIGGKEGKKFARLLDSGQQVAKHLRNYLALPAGHDLESAYHMFRAGVALKKFENQLGNMLNP